MSASRQTNGRMAGALTLLLVLLLLAGTGGLAGYLILQARWVEIEAAEAQLELLKRRAQSAVATRPAETPVSIKPFLPEESFALAANALQKRVVGVVEEADGRLITIGIDPQVTGDENSARRVSVHVVAEVTNEGLQKVLYELENQTPFVFIESLAVRPESREQDDRAKAQREPRLNVAMSVIGYRGKGQ